MRRSRDLAQRDDHELEMTPMIDVTFLLLIFFMCTLKFKDLEGLLAAHLPHDVGPNPSQAEEPPEPVEVRVVVVEAGTKLKPDGRAYGEAGTGRFIYGEDRVVEYRVGPWRTTDLEALEARVQAQREAREPLQDEPVRAVVNPDADTVHEDVMAVLDRLTGAGFRDVTLAGAE